MIAYRYILDDPSRHREAREAALALAADYALPLALAPDESNGAVVNGVLALNARVTAGRIVPNSDEWPLQRFDLLWKAWVAKERPTWKMRRVKAVGQ